ncbi:MAG: uroporphyrinogen decarboxylase family protein [Candidatus Brocadiia bacterium]
MAKSSAASKWTPIPAGLSKMTLRERWVRTMHYKKADRLPMMEFGYWDETLPLWHEQGLPRTVRTEAQAYAYFGIEDWRDEGVNTDGLCPGFERETIEETEDYIIWRDEERAVKKESKKDIKTIPHFMDYGLKNREDWKLFKARLNPDTPGRFPADWEKRVKAFQTRDYPLCIHIGSLIGRPRNWAGFENIGVLAYDDPALFEEIIETICVCGCAVIERTLKDVTPDFGAGWEDICFKNGPIISPKMFDKWIVPRYKRITDLLLKHGVDVVWTDCDGNLMPILDQFLAGGINCMFPLEVAGGTDPVAIREKYGRRVLLQGGVDKIALLKGPKGIEQELLRLKPLVEDGGFVPHVDHRCPADVTLENYKFYLKLKRQMFNAGDLKPHYKE